MINSSKIRILFILTLLVFSKNIHSMEYNVNKDIVCEYWGYKSFLAINNRLGDNDKQYAFFGTREYLNTQPQCTTNIKLIPDNNNGWIFFECSHGISSGFLSVNLNDLAGKSWGWAEFSTMEYLRTHLEYSRNLILVPDGNGTLGNYIIQCNFNNFGGIAYLVSDGLVPKNNYQRAFFATEEYINNDRLKYNLLRFRIL